MNITPRITTIPPLAATQGLNLELELRLTKGPTTIGQPGDRTYGDLYSRDYLVFLDQTGRLRMYVSTGTSWAPVAEDLYPQPPHPGNQIRHIAVCFDQNAKPVLAYELDNRVYVYQWNETTQQYTTYGPFPGVDPVLIQDATISFYPPDSDVLLLHLSTDRTRLIMRVQRESYGTPREAATFSRPVLLDQANAFPYYGQVVGSYVDSPNRTGFAVLTNLYPVNTSDFAGRVNITPPTDWGYTFLGTLYEASDNLGSSVIAPPTEWSYASIRLVVELPQDTLGRATVSAPTNWSYAPILATYEGGTDRFNVAISPPTNWSYVRV